MENDQREEVSGPVVMGGVEVRGGDRPTRYRVLDCALPISADMQHPVIVLPLFSRIAGAVELVPCPWCQQQQQQQRFLDDRQLSLRRQPASAIKRYSTTMMKAKLKKDWETPESVCPDSEATTVVMTAAAATAAVNTKTTMTTAAVPLPASGSIYSSSSSSSSLLCHVFRRHVDLALEELEAKDVDAVAVVTLRGETVALDFRESKSLLLLLFYLLLLL